MTVDVANINALALSKELFTLEGKFSFQYCYLVDIYFNLSLMSGSQGHQLMQMGVERHEKYNRTKAPCGHSFHACIDNAVTMKLGCRLIEDAAHCSNVSFRTLSSFI